MKNGECKLKENVNDIFINWNETLIWSCLQGVMGEICTNTTEDAAMAILRDFAFFAGNRSNGWANDLVSQFENYDLYKKSGLGVVILKDGELVAGASSYSRYREGIEIEIDTREDHRRNGLAYACGAKLILECLKRGLYPSWDAQNQWSVALAEKLGYHFSHEYTAYEIRGYY